MMKKYFMCYFKSIDLEMELRLRLLIYQSVLVLLDMMGSVICFYGVHKIGFSDISAFPCIIFYIGVGYFINAVRNFMIICITIVELKKLNASRKSIVCSGAKNIRSGK